MLPLLFTHIAEGHYLNINTDTALVIIIIMIKQLFHRTTVVSVKKKKISCVHICMLGCLMNSWRQLINVKENQN